MPLWAWVAIAGGALLLVAACVALGILGWRVYERRTLLRLLVRAEAVEAAGAALVDTVERLARGSDEELELFADDPDSGERKALTEVYSRAGILRDELDKMPLPRRFVSVADALADAAFVIAEQAASVGDTQTGTEALEGLAKVDLAVVRAYTQKARMLVTGACDVCGLEDTAVYGGGLYL